MFRLASFRGPSTPTASPARQTTPSSPSRLKESTFHRKTRSLLLELRSITETWDDLILIDGLKAIRSLVDLRTDLHNALAIIPDRMPRTHLLVPKLALMEKRIAELDSIVIKLQKQFRKMNSTIDNLEAVLYEAHKAKGWEWVQTEPLWVTWPLEKFVISIPSILPAYHRSLNLHIELVNLLRSHSVPFDESRAAVSKWVEQPFLEDSGWQAEWEDICVAEVERWEKD
ncbi:hypothetical protein K443DRAFT_129889 [Laccaria amethystina LaAM-08-1]|uniref:Uncharacterized protein n=1 Tax=Laccaria amethystina LaAM-08-1 TaxID=1095629 RepID=A0A0C9XYA0_9AGAR|nr:hypothetical protein K443DRAFT_129889 [Laccaria amethystina LaAM-08-1]